MLIGVHIEDRIMFSSDVGAMELPVGPWNARNRTTMDITGK